MHTVLRTVSYVRYNIIIGETVNISEKTLSYKYGLFHDFSPRSLDFPCAPTCSPPPPASGSCQRHRPRLLLRPPLPGGGLPSLSFPDLGRRRRGWVLCLPPAPPPPRPLRRLPPRPGPGAERPERVGQNFRKKRTYQVYKYKIPFRAQSETGN